MTLIIVGTPPEQFAPAKSTRPAAATTTAPITKQPRVPVKKSSLKEHKANG